MIKLSIVAPVYNEEASVKELHREIVAAINPLGYSYEIIFVDDGSSDDTVKNAIELKPLKLVSLQRNYGQTPAIDVGINQAHGEIIVLLDADLQNDPADIPKLLTKMEEGYDVVIGQRQGRKEKLGRVIFSKIANSVARGLLGVKIHDFGCGLKAYRSRLIKDFRLWGESQVFLPAVAKSRGAKIGEVFVTYHPRQFGSAKVKISKMVRGVLDLFSIVFFVKYFSKPLRFFGGWGLVSLFLSVIAFAGSIYLKIAEIKNFSDSPLPLIGTLFAISGVVLFMMGLLAEMILRIYYQEIKYSPYVIKEIKDQN
ncbi:MAG: glycosyltransferase family 2 protein [bacterium]|nr:glycosyltransferase family 2 protein [bacterium]